MDVWMWLVLALTCVAAETQLAGTFVSVFFAVGAACVALGMWAGFLPDFWQQSLTFGGVSTLSLLALRGRLKRRRPAGDAERIDELVGAEARVLEDLAPQAVGQVELRGVPWRAQSHAAAALPAGSRCWVRGIDGLTLQVIGQPEAKGDPSGPAGGRG